MHLNPRTACVTGLYSTGSLGWQRRPHHGDGSKGFCVSAFEEEAQPTGPKKNNFSKAAPSFWRSMLERLAAQGPDKAIRGPSSC